MQAIRVVSILIFGLVATSHDGHAQWTETCQIAEGGASYEDKVCRCPDGTIKIRRSDRDLTTFGRNSGVRSFDCRPTHQYQVACIVARSTSGKACPDEISVTAVNNCDAARMLRICIEIKGGGLNCAFSSVAIPKGQAFTHRACNAQRLYSAGVKSG